MHNYNGLSRTDAREQEALVRNLVSRGVVDRVDASKKMQTLDISLEDGHKPSRVEHLEHYGVTYHPNPGAELIALAVGGNRDHVVVVNAADRRYRMTNLAQGELAVHDDQGQMVHFKRGGIHVKSGKGVTIECDAGIKLIGPIEIEGDITQAGSIESSGIHKAAGHV